MKCVKNLETKTIAKVKDDLAHQMVAAKTHKYVPKSEWKKKVRDVKGGLT